MTEISNIRKAKYSSLKKAFQNLGYNISNEVDQKELLLFLNKRTSSGNFDPILGKKLFQVLNIGKKTKIPINQFIEGFLIFDNELTRNAEAFKIKFVKEKEIYNKILKQCELYKSEKLNKEGFCKNAKIYGKITDIDIKKKLHGIKEIIILVIFNNKQEELRFKIGDDSSNLKKSFQFKPKSRKDHFEFIMKGINSKGKEFDIGSKVFPLSEINSQEEYFVQIIVPEIDRPKQIAAFINANIVLYMSDFKYYENLKNKQEKILMQYKRAENKAIEYLNYVREIYGDLSLIKPELIVDFNNEKLMKRKGAKLNVNIENEFEEESPKGNYFVEYNNEIKFEKKSAPLKIEFNNSKQNKSPFIEKKKIESKYKINYNNSIKKNIKKKEELKSINLKQNNEKENININIISKMPDKFQIANELKTEEIKNIKIDSNTKEKNNKNLPHNLNEIKETKKIIIQKELKTSKSDLGKILENQKIGKLNLNIKEIIIPKNKQNISKSPGTIRTTNQNKNNFNLTSLLNQKNINEMKNWGNAQNKNNTTKTIKTTLIQNNQNKNQIESLLKEKEFANIKKIEQTNQNQINNKKLDSSEYEEIDIDQILKDYSKQNTQTKEVHNLKPIINKVNYDVSVNKAILNETTSKIMTTQNTLPVKYLPEKVNKILVSDQVTYLPLATTEKKITYDTTTPIVYESQNYFKNENEMYLSNLNNFSFGQNYASKNNIYNLYNDNNANNIINYSNDVINNQGYNSSYINYDNNRNNYNYNINNSNLYNTVQAPKQIIKTKRLPLENNSGFIFQSQTQGLPINQSQQVYY